MNSIDSPKKYGTGAKCNYTYKLKVKRKCKAIPATGRGGQWIPHCLGKRPTDGGEVVSLKSRPRFTLRMIFWYSYLLEVE
jgi:hypothetical protein